VALITALLLVALATVIAAKLSWDTNIGIRRTESTLMQEQARLFALGGEAIAIDLLRQDENQEFDNANEDWWQLMREAGLIEIGIEETVLGQMRGYLTDVQGRMNVNNLLAADNGKSRQQFESLFRTLRLNPALVDAIVDWIDPDTVAEPGGAEDGTYTALKPPYRPANNYLTSISELRAISGIDDETYNLLVPHVTALHPDWCGSEGGITPVNLNFATAEVMGSLDEELGLGQGEAWVEERGESGWESLNDIADLPEGLSSYVAVRTDCLELIVIVNIGSSVLSMYSLLDRSGGGEDIVTRVRAYGLD
jgi:general secretion pathway protein K